MFEAKILAGDNKTLLEYLQFSNYEDAERWARAEISRRGWNLFAYIYKDGLLVRCL